MYVLPVPVNLSKDITSILLLPPWIKQSCSCQWRKCFFFCDVLLARSCRLKRAGLCGKERCKIRPL